MDTEYKEFIDFCVSQNFDVKVKEKYFGMDEIAQDIAMERWQSLSWLLEDDTYEECFRFVVYHKRERNEAIEKIAKYHKECDASRIAYVGMYNSFFNAVVFDFTKKVKEDYKHYAIIILCRPGKMQYLAKLLNKGIL